MHIQLGLLWLCFKIIQGEINRCPIGGICDSELCSSLNKDAVFYRFYLNGFQTEIIGNKDNKYDVYDVAYNGFKEVSKNEAVDSELNALDPLDVMRPSKRAGELFYRQENTITMDEYTRMYMKIIFRQSLIVDCNPVDSKLLDPMMRKMRPFEYNNCFNEQGRPTNIKTLWDETLSIGTDTYRLKFHNKLIRTYKSQENKLSKEDCIVFMETYYNAASTYFFSRTYRTALYKIEDGIKFGLNVRDLQFKDVNTSKESLVLNTWLWLCESFKQEILIYVKTDVKLEDTYKASTIDKTSNQPKELSYSSVSVLFYRKYFLDDILEEHKKERLKNSAIEHFIPIKDNAIIYTKYNSMYNHLLLATFGKTDKVKLENIIKAIQLPVLSIEDRLLNYKALSITMEMLHLCLDENGLLANSVRCEPMNELIDENRLFREIIIPKLKNVFRVMHNKDIIMKLIDNLSTQNAIISERLLHVIVTSPIDFAELEPSNYKKHIKTVKSAIEVLEYFVKVLVEEKEKSENNKTEKDNKSVSEENFDKDDFIISSNPEDYTKKMVESLSNLTYSMIDQKTKNVFIAYKWLAELYGVLCDNSIHLTKYQRRLNKYIGLADKFSKNIDIDDDHLKYLKNKQDAKILLANNSWEVNKWLGGWYFSNLKTETSKILNTSEKGEKSKMLEDLNYLRNNSKCPYINKIEINILLYRLYVMDSVKNDYKQMYQYLNCAINEIVITSEDRTRNMEAHELFSMYLMIDNRHEIEKMFKGKENTNINNTVVNKMPSDEVKNNTGTQYGWIQYILGEK